jgi:hypothetical protein
MAAALLDLPRTLERSVREANALMEVSRDQLELMRRQADEALAQAERMNDLLARVVKLTEPLEKAQRGGEYVVGGLKQAIFGEEAGGGREVVRAEEAAELAEAAADDAEAAAADAESATDKTEDAIGDATEKPAPQGPSHGTTIRVIPNRPTPEEDEREQ